MTLRFAALLLCALLSAAPLTLPAAEGRFAEAIPDLPLMEALTEDGEAVVFDKPSGRIVEMTARGALARPEVEAFYDRTLPELGWRRLGPGRFEREAESLTLLFREEGSELLVRFVLAPQG